MDKTQTLFSSIFISVTFLFTANTWADQPNIAIGSKAFTESYVLAELVSQTLEAHGVKVDRKFGMGGTGILFQALKHNEIQLYPEYTGTVAEAILQNPKLKRIKDIEQVLWKNGLVMSEPLGFNNTYALAMRKDQAERMGISTISDLTKPGVNVRVGFSHEFMTRADGFDKLKDVYHLPWKNTVTSLEHSLAYEAIRNKTVDVIDVYSTDAKIEKLNLLVLRDDRHFFPEYQAVILARKDFVEKHPSMWKAINTLKYTIDEKTMTQLNYEADIEKKDFGKIIAAYRGHPQRNDKKINQVLHSTLVYGRQHIVLVLISVFFAVLVGVPLGVFAAKNKHLRQFILIMSGILQTIPSLALLCFLIPLFGIGTKPALVALFLYGLLPVVLNTYTGLTTIDARLIEMERAMGLKFLQRLFLIELPLASRNILSGIKMSTIIGIGTATLAALIGSGGYGVPIVRGLALNDMHTILLGAVPAALLAFIAHFVFELLAKVIVPRGLR